MSNPVGEPDASGARNYSSVGGSFGVNMPGLTQATSQITQLNAALTSLQATMSKIQSSTSGFTNSITNMTKSLGTMSSGGTTTYGMSGNSFGNLSSSLFGPNSGGALSDIALFPARFINTQLQNNRNVVNATGQVLGSQAFGSGTTIQAVLSALSRQLGGVMGGNPADLLSLMDIGRQAGARVDWRTAGSGGNGPQNAPRAAGFLEAVRQGQLISPGTDVGTIAGSVGGFLANTGAQQQGAFLTGGAFSMVGAGNRAKSISEWSEGILKWFMNQRPGSMRGKPFNYGELMSQNFPGSNMDAWFSANGVPQDMRDYFWSYALGKASQSQTGTTGGAPILQQGQAPSASTQQNPVYQRLAAGNVSTTQSFNLGSKLTGVYGNIEQSNRWFNDLLSQMVGTTLPGALAQGSLSWMQYLPDEVRDLLMTAAEQTKVGTLGAGVLGWGSLLNSGSGTGDVGDVGDYGSNGTSGLAGLHPDMRRKVSAMLKANPNLSITSGHRDLAKQQTLRRKGGNRVSGKPSDHTRGMAADIGPSSQYGWLVKNAGRFGLKSGVSAGEPWHVGMGDVGDIASDLQGLLGATSSDSSGLMGMFSGLLGSLSGAFQSGISPDAQMQGIAQGSATILKAIMSLFANPNADMSNLDFRDVYGSLTKYTQGFFASGATGLPSVSAPSLLGGSSTGGGFGAGGTQSLQAFFTEVLQKIGAPVTQNNLDKLAAMARQEGNRGGKFNPFNYVSGPGTNFNSVGVKNYADWDTGVTWSSNLLSGSKTANMRANLLNDSPYQGYLDATSAFYHSWGGGTISISQQNADAFLSHDINTGDVDSSGASVPVSSSRRGSTVVFQNHFTVNGGGGGPAGGSNSGIDVKRAASQIADVLEQQMKQRMSRYN